MNYKVRFKNPVFWTHVIVAVVSTIMAYNSLSPDDLNTWPELYRAFVGVLKNPYLLFSCMWAVWTSFHDPTTKGIKDSQDVLDSKECRK